MVDLGLAAKVRLCLIFSLDFGDLDRALVAVVPHTCSLRGSSFEVPLHVPFLESGAFDAQGLRPVPPRVLMRRLGSLTTEQMHAVERAVRRWLGLS